MISIRTILENFIELAPNGGALRISRTGHLGPKIETTGAVLFLNDVDPHCLLVDEDVVEALDAKHLREALTRIRGDRLKLSVVHGCVRLESRDIPFHGRLIRTLGRDAGRSGIAEQRKTASAVTVGALDLAQAAITMRMLVGPCFVNVSTHCDGAPLTLCAKSTSTGDELVLAVPILSTP